MRTVIWRDRTSRILVDDPDGDDPVVLLRSSEFDDGPARSISIPAEAIPAVAAVLLAIAVRRSCTGLAEALRRVGEQLNGG